MKKALIIHKNNFNTFPPLISVKYALNNLGFIVDVLSSVKVDSLFMSENELSFAVRRNNKRSVLGLLIWYLKFSRMIWMQKKNNIYDIIWVEGGDTLVLFFHVLFRHTQSTLCVFQLSELYDKYPLYRFVIGKNIKKFDNVVVPEINRAFILKVWYELNTLPHVLPNKNIYLLSADMDTDIQSKLQAASNFSNGRRIILYLGLVAKDRKFNGLLDFVNRFSSEYCLVIAGEDLGYLDEIKRQCRNFLFLGYVRPPSHLHLVELSHIALLAYDLTSLNKIYCAPNKIWEYTKFSKPILSQYLPSIDNNFKEWIFGECCDLGESSQVESAILKIESGYELYSRNALRFYNSFDYVSVVSKIVGQVV